DELRSRVGQERREGHDEGRRGEQPAVAPQAAAHEQAESAQRAARRAAPAGDLANLARLGVDDDHRSSPSLSIWAGSMRRSMPATIAIVTTRIRTTSSARRPTVSHGMTTLTGGIGARPSGPTDTSGATR